MSYDSKEDTWKHIDQVGNLIDEFRDELRTRQILHDKSKLHSPEKELFDKYTPLLKAVTYGSDEYKEYLKEMGVALQHHYEHNSHHPEHYEWGIHDMNLFFFPDEYCQQEFRLR